MNNLSKETEKLSHFAIVRQNNWFCPFTGKNGFTACDYGC